MTEKSTPHSAESSTQFAMNEDRTLPWDWFPGKVPENVMLDSQAYLETSYSFHLFRSAVPRAVRIGSGVSIYLGTMFDVGLQGRVCIGPFTLLHGARIICDSQIDIGSHCLISWNVVLMDSHRLPRDPAERRRELERVPTSHPRHCDLAAGVSPRPIRIQSNVWIGFDACILPGVTIGEGSIVGARTVVHEDLPPYSVAAGNPARIIRKLNPGDLPSIEGESPVPN